MDGICAGEITNDAHSIPEHGRHTLSRDLTSKHTEPPVTINFIKYCSFIVSCNVQVVHTCPVWDGAEIAQQHANKLLCKGVAAHTANNIR